MNDIRLTLLTTSFPLESQSVSGIFIYRLVKHLPSNIFTTVITPAAQGVVDRMFGERIHVRSFRYAPKRFELLAHSPGGIPVALKDNKWLYLLIPTFLFFAFINCARSGARSKVIHANWAINGVIAGLAGKLLRTPVVTTLRGEDVTRAQKYHLDRLLLRVCLFLSTRVVVVSEAMKLWLCTEYPKLAPRVRLIENGVENVFLEVHKRRGEKKSDSEVKVLTIGSLIPRKGIDQIIGAMAQAVNRENVRLSIIGTGPEAAALNRMAEDLGLARNVRFIGQVAASEIPNTLADADVFVLASHSEGRPNVILEAMAAGLPVIATNIDGNKELITHNENGLLFQDGAVEELARHIECLSRDVELRDKLGGNGRRFILEHGLTWSNAANRYSELYSSLI